MTRTTLTNTDRFFVFGVILVVLVEFAFPQATHAAPQAHMLTAANAAFSLLEESNMSVTDIQERATRTRARNSFTVTVTSYSSTIDQTDDTPFITASGTFVRDGVVAANFLPIGTRLRMPDYFGDKEFVVEDRMNTRYWQRIDIWQPTREGAKQWGIKRVRVELL